MLVLLVSHCQREWLITVVILTQQNIRYIKKCGNLERKTFFIELIEEYPECQNIEQLRKREGHYIRELKASLNQLIAGRSQKEYNKDNAEYISERNKQYRIDNIDSVHKYEKMRWNRAKPKRQALNKRMYQNKKDEILKYQAEKIECERGCISTRNHLLRHQKSRKHIQSMEALQHP